MTINSKMGTVTRLANGKQVQFSLLGRTRDFEWFVSECFNIVRMCDEKRSLFYARFPTICFFPLLVCLFVYFIVFWGSFYGFSLFMLSFPHQYIFPLFVQFSLLGRMRDKVSVEICLMTDRARSIIHPNYHQASKNIIHPNCQNPAKNWLFRAPYFIKFNHSNDKQNAKNKILLSLGFYLD